MNTSLLLLGLFLVGQVGADEPTEIPPRVTAAPPVTAVDDAYEDRSPVATPGDVTTPPTATVPLESALETIQPESTGSKASANRDPSRETWTAADVKIRPVDLLKQASAAPATGALTGQAVTLLEALSSRRGGDRQGQIEITHAYWKLSVATAAFHFSLDEKNRLNAIIASVKVGDEALLQSAQASAEARSLEHKAIALLAQHDLSALMFRLLENDLPLASDLPHVGSYSTRFDELFAQRPPSVPAYAIDQTLPLVRKAIGLRTVAVTAAVKAVDESWTGYENNVVALDTLLSRLAQLSLQRRAFLTNIRSYNDDIADYALPLPPLGTSSRDLVAMLIRTRTTPERAAETSLEVSPEKSTETSSVPKKTAVRDGFVRRD